MTPLSRHLSVRAEASVVKDGRRPTDGAARFWTHAHIVPELVA